MYVCIYTYIYIYIYIYICIYIAEWKDDFLFSSLLAFEPSEGHRYLLICSRVERWLCDWQLKLYEHLPLSSRKISAYDCLCLSLRKSLFWMMYFEKFSPGTSFEAGRSPRAWGPGRRRVLQRAFGRLCGASRELWEGCRRFWKGFGRQILIFHWF